MAASRPINRRVWLVVTALALALLPQRAVQGRAATPAPPLPAPAGAVVNVSTEPQLQAAVRNIASNQTIVIAPGTYTLTSTLYVNKAVTNASIRGASNNRDDVVLKGPGMTTASYGNTPYGIWTGGGVQGILIANLTLRDFYFHSIIFNAGTQSPRVYNVRLLDDGQQLLKSNPDPAGGGVNNGIVEYSVIEYTTTAPSDYTNGIDVHAGANWIIRDNLFRNIVSPPGSLAGPAILMWNHSSNTITERNSFANCARAIAYGLQVIANNDHVGGVIRNNSVFRAQGQSGDVGISLADSPNTQVLNNTVFLSGTYSSPIEYRFASTKNVVVGNNLVDGVIAARDGATGVVGGNLEGATAALFVNAAAGDLHLARTATSAIDRGLNTPNVTDDWDGEARPQGSAYDIGADEYAGSTNTFQIGGRIVDASGAAMAAVAVALSGARTASASTDAAGSYAFAALAPGVNYTVTPAKSGYSFRPADAFFGTLSANQSANFIGTADAATTPPPATPPPSGGSGLVIDLVAFRDQATAAGRTLTTNTFSTSAPNELLLAFIAADDPAQAGIVASGVTGAGAAWQLVRRTNVQLGTAEVWRAFAPAAVSGTSVTATLSAAAAGSVTVVAFKGADASGANGSAAIGATASANARPGAPTASLTTTRDNSWVFGIGNDFDNPIAHTPAADQTLVHQYMPSVGDTYWVQRTNSPTPASGTRVTINDTAPTGDRYNLTIVEVLAAGSSATTPPTTTPTTPPVVTVTSPASGQTFTAPASIAVTASATAGSGATITRVEFFAGTTSLGSKTAAPYTMMYSNVAAGGYSLTVVATDSVGASTRSAPVGVTVNPAATPPPPSPTPTTGGALLQAANLVYEGAFRVPKGTIGPSSFAYGGTALGFNPARSTLFAVGHVYDQDAAEISIPSIRNSTTITALDTASVLQPFADPTDGKLGSVGPSPVRVGGLLPYQGKLLATGWAFYDASSQQTLSHFVGGMDLSAGGDTQGAYRVGSLGAGFVSGYMGLIPAAWQAALGGTVLTGNCCIPIVGRTSFGPSVSAFDPANLGSAATSPSTPLVYYPQDHPINSWSATSTVWNGSTTITGVVMPEGSRSVLFFGRHGTGPFCYGPGTSDRTLAGQPADGGVDTWCYDPADSSKGTHGYPYAYTVWAYDANDLAAVKAGAKAGWDLRPYAMWPLSLPFSRQGEAQINGAAYDPQTGRVFLSQAFGDGDYPVIHVFDVRP